jgi:FkbM family methyltransferase
MKFLGRSPKRFIFALFSLHYHLIAAIRCIFLFRHPLELLYLYFRRQNPASNKVELRNGHTLYLSGDSSDIVTVYLIFCRHDYGKIDRGSTIVDIGSNIGIYSIYAAMNGARMVYAYEPCEESYNSLQKNISENNFSEIIKPFNAVVMGLESKPVLFPRKSDVMNTLPSGIQGDSELFKYVDVITFQEITKQLPEKAMVKMDCEGGEFDIVLNSDSSAFNNVPEIRLEYHKGPHEQLFSKIKQIGYELSFIEKGVDAGILWCLKK